MFRLNLNTLETKYLGATIRATGINSRGSRKSLTVGWDYALNDVENHVAAAKAWHNKHYSGAEQTYRAARSSKTFGIWHFVPNRWTSTYTF